MIRKERCFSADSESFHFEINIIDNIEVCPPEVMEPDLKAYLIASNELNVCPRALLKQYLGCFVFHSIESTSDN